MSSNDKAEFENALDWLDTEGKAKPDGGGGDDSGGGGGGDDDDWLGLGDTITVEQADLGDRYMVEAVLRKIQKKIHSASLDELLLELKEDLQTLFSADRVSIYVADRIKKILESKVKNDAGGIVEIQVPIGPQSLAGFVAATGREVSVADAYDDKEVKGIHPHLNFDVSWDQKSGYRTRQVLAVPVKVGRRVEGVVQLVNRDDEGPFTGRQKRILMEVAESLAVAFSNQKRQRVRRSKFDKLFSMYLVNEDMIDEAEQLSRAEGLSLEYFLSEKFHVPKKEILASLSQFFRVDPTEFSPDWVTPGEELLKHFSVEFLKHHGCCPLGYDEKERVIVAFVNPKDIPLRDTLSRRLDKPLEPRVATREDVHAFVEKFFPSPEEGMDAPDAGALTDLVASIDFDTPDSKAKDTPVEEMKDDTGLMKLVNQIIEHAYHRGVSDIHIEPYPEAPITVRYRIDGVCQVYTKLPQKFARAIVSRLKIMSDLDISERRLPQDGKIKFKQFANLDIELRVATLPTVGGMEDVVMRILASSKPLPLDKMGFMEDNLTGFKEQVAKPYGLVLVVGPTGSGKTTTLHSALGFINKPETKIWTAEDPVEITQAGLRQVQVKPKIGFTFARAMRAFLRADPDVIMIGEMRDKETAETGVEASLTGHLVFSTLHTNSAPETVTRLLDMEIDPYSFGDALLGVLAQRLIRRLCKCKEEYTPDAEEMAALKAEYGYDEGWTAKGIEDAIEAYRLKGCPKCEGNGYKGRMGIHEFMAGSDEIRSIIYRHGQVSEIREQALKEGMTTLKQDGIRKVLLGHTDIKEIRRVCIK